MRLILLGCPGAGKGTQAQFIQKKYRIPQISTGNIFREAVAQNTELGKKVKQILEEGRLVPDDVVTDLVKERISAPDCQNGFLLDGYPRTLAQAEALQKLTNIDAVIDLEVPQEEIVQRLSGRRIHPASGRTYHLSYQPPRIADQDDVTGDPLIQRPDDREETVRKRLMVYYQQTAPVQDYYIRLAKGNKDRNLQYIKVDGVGSLDEIKEKIFSNLDKIRK